MAVLSVWAKPFCTTRQFWYGALRSEARIHPGHAAVIFGHVWQLETAYRTVCHFVCPWPTFSPSPNLLPSGPCVADRNGTPHRVPFGLPLAGFFSRYVTSSWRVSTPNLPRFRSKEGRHI